MFKIKSISKYFYTFFNSLIINLKYKYFKTNYYNQIISKKIPSRYIYRPSPHIINSLISLKKKKIKIENLSLNSIWNINSENFLEFENLHNFLWLNTLDIKTSKIATHNIIENWIENNNIFNQKTWKLDILSKRIISWLSNSNLTLEASNLSYRNKFNLSIIKQANHLFNNINNEKNYEKQLVGCTALILIGLIFKEYEKSKITGLEILKKIIKINFDYNGFPKSRNPQEINENLKYFIIIREWIKESQNPIPEFLDEIIHSLGSSFVFINNSFNHLPLFNGATSLNNEEFKNYLNNLGYNFKNDSNKCGEYYIIKNKKISFIMDVGGSVTKKFSKKYQAGCLSFEITSNNEKLICNSGFYFKNNDKLKTLLSKSTAAHSTLYIDNHSSCSLDSSSIKNGLKVTFKKINFNKDFDEIIARHNGYQKKYGYSHERKIKFLKKNKVFLGTDSLVGNDDMSNVDFGIRFHIMPGTKVAKTQNSNTVLLSARNGEGWKFICNEYKLIIERGIYLGSKNKIIENQNIYISGITEKKDLSINWILEKIS
tara:strand:+ start:1301 stop:2929 length:1629 start_codon:yes stop_codon:yes gene_type:complete